MAKALGLARLVWTAPPDSAHGSLLLKARRGGYDAYDIFLLQFAPDLFYYVEERSCNK